MLMLGCCLFYVLSCACRPPLAETWLQSLQLMGKNMADSTSSTIAAGGAGAGHFKHASSSVGMQAAESTCLPESPSGCEAAGSIAE